MNASKNDPDMPADKKRRVVSILEEICKARSIGLATFSDGWIQLLSRDGRTLQVFGFEFGINSATARMICKDKSAASDLLKHFRIPHVEHRLFFPPTLRDYNSSDGNWRDMIAAFEEFGRDAVCKPNEGSGGHNVFRVRTHKALEAAVGEIFATSQSLCLSPFEKIGGEFRIAVLKGKVAFTYEKERPCLTGDGCKSIRGLALEHLGETENFRAEAAAIANFAEENPDGGRIPHKGERVYLNWRHNLGQGSKPRLLVPDDPALRPLAELALEATRKLDIALASVDVAITADGPKILELNSGIMMEHIAASSPEGYALAYNFYDSIVCEALNLEK